MHPILSLSAADISACEALSAEAEWNQTVADWRFILTHGEAFGLRAPDLIASAAILPYGPSFGWICMVLVTKREQRRGYAMRLMRHCLDQLSQRRLVAGLDATPAGRTVYLQLGFRDIYSVSRLAAQQVSAKSSAELPAGIRPLLSAELPEIRHYDMAPFGGDRGNLLNALHADLSANSFIATQGHKTVGYVLARKGRFATQIGPLVAETSETACALAEAAIGASAGPLFIDVPDHQTIFKSWLLGRGFALQRGFTRMLLDHSEPFDMPDRIMALTGPEFA